MEAGFDALASNWACAMKCLVDKEPFKFSYMVYEGLLGNIQGPRSKDRFSVYLRFLQMIFNDKLQNLNTSRPTLDLQHTKKCVFNDMRSKTAKSTFSHIFTNLFPNMLGEGNNSDSEDSVGGEDGSDDNGDDDDDISEDNFEKEEKANKTYHKLLQNHTKKKKKKMFNN
ncbi:hypothetical protein L1987_40853 [Smallanthus sonchifolius]|uniref:Uncharacterized protein n=1 Tax=Smallanthus sonchifolius TaxID=185202 RepID=A0ACB9GTY9_9ASTR|nr:hypothetical protein L1987_40853 [Smallanthus sonchifolius]